jgi:hypothetical protein
LENVEIRGGNLVILHASTEKATVKLMKVVKTNMKDPYA